MRGNEGRPRQRTGAYPRTRAEAAAKAYSRARRLARYEEVRRRVSAGEKLLAISRAMGLARGTVRHYASTSSFPERAARVPLASKLDPYLERLEARRAAGCENAVGLWRELRAPGLCQFVPAGAPMDASAAHDSPKTTPRRWRSSLPATIVVPPAAPAPTLPSARRLARLLIQEPE